MSVDGIRSPGSVIGSSSVVEGARIWSSIAASSGMSARMPGGRVRSSSLMSVSFS